MQISECFYFELIIAQHGAIDNRDIMFSAYVVLMMNLNRNILAPDVILPIFGPLLTDHVLHEHVCRLTRNGTHSYRILRPIVC